MKNDHSQTFSGYFFLQTSLKCKTADFDSLTIFVSCVYLKLQQQERVLLMSLLLLRLEATKSSTPSTTLVASFLARRRSCRAVFRRRCRSVSRQRQIAAQLPVKKIRGRHHLRLSFFSHENDTNDDFFLNEHRLLLLPLFFHRNFHWLRV